MTTGGDAQFSQPCLGQEERQRIATKEKEFAIAVTCHCLTYTTACPGASTKEVGSSLIDDADQIWYSADVPRPPHQLALLVSCVRNAHTSGSSPWAGSAATQPARFISPCCLAVLSDYRLHIRYTRLRYQLKLSNNAPESVPSGGSLYSKTPSSPRFSRN